MDKKYGPDLKKIRQLKPEGLQKRKNKGPYSGKTGSTKRQKLFEQKAEERRLKNIDHEIKDITEQYNTIDPSKVEHFKDFPISVRTLQGLLDDGFTTPTDIQRQSIGLAIQGHDILGAAKTGSGKTLAFLIPILECLYRQKWTNLDGMGALIISPVRELAYQTFEVLRKIGKKHDFSAGLVIGGKKLEEEAARIHRTNIVICTPGRLLQHMDETPYFEADSLQILVLDEADRILDLGFAPTMNAILQNLPDTRQTLLFSATQTKSVKDLARLSLKSPMFISAHEMSQHVTPTQLQQHYMICELHEKFNVLWSFISTHQKHKILVFLATSKQVKFVYEAFVRLRCSLTCLSLYGSMDQIRRVGTYESFCRKEHAVLFATDVAARGLDFPAVHWVVQFDCPEDTNTYIHRVGRTARYKEDGQALLMLLPSEHDSMVQQLQEKNIPIDEIRVNPRKIWSQQARLDTIAVADVEMKQKAQRAFTTYLKSVYLMKDKSVFNFTKLDTDKYARSLGLAVTPRIKFIEAALKRQKQQQLQSEKEKLKQFKDHEKATTLTNADTNIVNIHKSKNIPVTLSTFDIKSGSESDNSDHQLENVKNTETDKLKLKFSQDCDIDDDFLKVKQSPTHLKLDELDSETDTKKSGKKITKVAVAKKLLKREITVNKKTSFDKEGKIIYDRLKEAASSAKTHKGTGINIEEAKQFMIEEDKVDKEIYRQKIKKRHREEKLKAKEERREANRHRLQQKAGEDSEEDMVVTLGSNRGDDQDSGSESESDDNLTIGQGQVKPEKLSDKPANKTSSDSEESTSSDEEEAGPDAEESTSSDEDNIDNEDSGEDSSEESEIENKEKKAPVIKKIKRIRNIPKDDNFSDKLSVKDAEDLALNLLT